MKIRAFITHKLSEHYSDCQDRFCINSDNHAIAVSDGVSQSIFPDYWAEILSSFYAENGHCSNEDRKNLCNDWLKKVKGFINTEKRRGKNPWRLQDCIDTQNGAGATLCGMQFKDAENWVGHVLGDTCIIEINTISKELIKIHTSEEKPFDCYPDYYGSFPDKEGRGQIKEIKGKLSEGHCLLLVSDPFSEFLSNHKEDCCQWLNRILELKGHEDFCSLVDDWRHEGLHNDDSTLCIIESDGSMDFNIKHEDKISALIEKEESSIVSTTKKSSSDEDRAKTVLPKEKEEEEKVDEAQNSTIPEEAPKQPSTEEIMSKMADDFSREFSSRIESTIENAKRSKHYPAKKRKQRVNKTTSIIGLCEIRNLGKEATEIFKEYIAKFCRLLTKE